MSDAFPQWTKQGEVLKTNYCMKYCQGLWAGEHVVQDTMGATTDSTVTVLTVLNVNESDSGEYVCSVDGNSTSTTLLVMERIQDDEQNQQGPNICIGT